MKTTYFTTTHFIRHQGNVVNLTEYREKLAQLQGQPLPEQPQVCLEHGPPEPPRPRCRRSLLALDYIASVLLILTALLFIVKLL